MSYSFLSISRRWRLTSVAFALVMAATPPAAAGAAEALPKTNAAEHSIQDRMPSDASLASSLPGGFVSETKEVNGVRLHYVIGGRGKPLFLLPGWPETWWEFNKIMPQLAKTHRVIAVDIRGMGGSSKPETGYDKKTMAADIKALADALGYARIDIAGHDIGAMIAYAFAANYPQSTGRIALLDVPHPDESFYDLTLLPPKGQPAVGSGTAQFPVFLWWFALNQIPELPEALLTGRMRTLIDWLFDTQLRNRSAITEQDRAIYAAAYATPDAIRAGNAWYQTFRQDIDDQKAYRPIAAPLLMLAGERNYPFLKDAMLSKGTNVRIERVAGSSHYVPEDQPATTAAALERFFAR